MQPHLAFIVMAVVWSVPLASYAIWFVRRSERRARGRLQTSSSTASHTSSLVPDSRSRIQRDTRARSTWQFRSRSPGANRLADLVKRGAQTLQTLVPIR